ncbi:hypothetical protein BaRGS_00034825 [Batillaria attramentaria]|uniref:Uncharacterized protein n=1 Tax=Batillaria attramentaria TaxID=370345 RepID=A0ABD0JGG0_9CAEN
MYRSPSLELPSKVTRSEVKSSAGHVEIWSSARTAEGDSHLRVCVVWRCAEAAGTQTMACLVPPGGEEEREGCGGCGGVGQSLTTPNFYGGCSDRKPISRDAIKR